MDELVAEFLTETRESLELLDNEIITLEQNPNDKALLSNIFRVMHTVKGTCGFLGLSRLEGVAHAGENVLGLYRDGVLEVKPESVSLILESLDRIKEIVDGIEQTGEEPQGDDAPLIAKLDEIVNSQGGIDVIDDDIFTPVPASETAALANNMSSDSANKTLDDIFQPVPADLTGMTAAEIMAIDVSKLEPQNIAVSEPEQTPAVIEAPKPVVQVKAEEPKKEVQAIAQTLRVNVDALENLMTMVSELVLTRNQLLQILRDQSETEFTGPLQRLNHVVSDLQEGVMKTRMQPIGNAWSKLPRIIRDLSQELNKKINLDMRGQETELDRQVLELIKDPLTHMVRNSADHGIEMPADRVAAGKPEMGTVLLQAFHEGGYIIIEIKDDGKGIPVDVLKRKIVEKNIATQAEVDAMTDTQVQKHIFHAGFSTAEKVTAVSGRGVGMDVVRTNIEKIGGTVDLKSVEGQGSSFTIKIPLTLAIVSALIVEVAQERYAIPQLSVKELVRATGTGEHRIEYLKGTPVLRLRDRLLPLVSMKTMLKMNDKNLREKITLNDDLEIDVPENNLVDTIKEQTSTTDMSGDIDVSSEHYIVVTQIGTYTFGIIVDRVFDTEEIVVKPISPMLRHIPIYAGNTVLGDGSVIMILDPNGIANESGDLSATDTAIQAEQDNSGNATASDTTSLLVFRAGSGAPKAVPLSLIARLEDIESKDIEYSNNQYVVQYRGQLMPLVPFSNEIKVDAGAYNTDNKENSSLRQGYMPVLVFADHLRSMGLIVDEIIDIVEEKVTVETSTANESTFGTAIIDGKATDVINVGHYLNKGHKDWFGIAETDDPFEGDVSKRVLMVDDSPFFRNMLVPLLTIGGYDVTAVEGPKEAFDMLDKKTFDIIISDIEMPDISGFEFAEQLRGSKSKWSNLPMIALSSHATPDDMARGKAVGFDSYVPKFDKDEIMVALNEALLKSNRKECENTSVLLDS